MHILQAHPFTSFSCLISSTFGSLNFIHSVSPLPYVKLPVEHFMHSIIASLSVKLSIGHNWQTPVGSSSHFALQNSTNSFSGTCSAKVPARHGVHTLSRRGKDELIDGAWFADTIGTNCGTRLAFPAITSYWIILLVFAAGRASIVYRTGGILSCWTGNTIGTRSCIYGSVTDPAGQGVQRVPQVLAVDA